MDGAVTLLGDAPLSIAALDALARGTGRIALSDAARARLQAARAVVERHAAGDAPVYGLNTGLGGNLGVRLDMAAIEAFQTQLIRGRMIGVGPPLAPEVCRAALIARIASAARGGSGLSPAVVEALVALANAGVTPVIPGRGSIGASDLGLCAHMAAVAIGLGEAWLGGERLPGAVALARAGLAPARLGAKDGLALCSANAVTAGHAALLLVELDDLLLIAAATAALAMEGYAANPAVFDPRIAAARPAAGQARAAALFRALLVGSGLGEPGAAARIQDALSFRTVAPVFGAVLAAQATAVAAVETEIDGAGDNPLVIADAGLMLSNANFHTPAIALAFDTLAIGLAHLATASAWRTIKLMMPAFSGLAKHLSPAGGASNGLNSLQKTAAALHAEVRLKAAPASLDSLPVSETVEDHAPQTPLAIRKLEEQMLPFRLLVAIEALAAAQAVDLRAGARLAPPTARLRAAIRTVVPMLDEDRETGPDVDRVAAMLRSRTLAGDLRDVMRASSDPRF